MRSLGLNYELNSVVSHDGDQPQSGHYIAHVRCNSQWLLVDDAQCKPVPQVDFKNAYLFAYYGTYIPLVIAYHCSHAQCH
jgi:ubiquitin C-terminal hydrolase